MIITILALVLVGLAFLAHAIKHAAVGYEDDYGFHEGAIAPSPLAVVTEIAKPARARRARMPIQARTVPTYAAQVTVQSGSEAHYLHS